MHAWDLDAKSSCIKHRLAHGIWLLAWLNTECVQNCATKVWEHWRRWSYDSRSHSPRPFFWWKFMQKISDLHLFSSLVFTYHFCNADIPASSTVWQIKSHVEYLMPTWFVYAQFRNLAVLADFRVAYDLTTIRWRRSRTLVGHPVRVCGDAQRPAGHRVLDSGQSDWGAYKLILTSHLFLAVPYTRSPSPEAPSPLAAEK